MNETHANGSVKPLRRGRHGRVIAGVCSGIGEYLGVDPNILRLALAVASFFGGLGVGVYAAAWLLIPEQDTDTSILHDLINKNKDGHLWQDARARWESAQHAWSRPTGQSSGDERQRPAGGSAAGAGLEDGPRP